VRNMAFYCAFGLALLLSKMAFAENPLDTELTFARYAPSERSFLTTLYEQLVQADPNKKTVVKVRAFKDNFVLNSAEASILRKRDVNCHKALEKQVGFSFDANCLPRIAICGCGGGYRAMYSLAGLLSGFTKTGVMDICQYIDALSGSTWALAPWYLSKLPFDKFAPELIARTVKNPLGLFATNVFDWPTSVLDVIAASLLRRLAFNETPTVIDLYGYLIARSTFDKTSKGHYLQIGAQHMIDRMAEGDRPIPLFTAVTIGKHSSYHWVEFSPLEVAFYDQHVAIPAWSLGRKFSKGVSEGPSPFFPLGFFMGVWGSAISASFKEAYNTALDGLQPQALFAPLKDLAEETPVGDIRLFPACINNPAYHMEGMPDADMRSFKFVDAGVDHNIPIAPLLQPARGIDLIIICDTSGNLPSAQELYKAERFAKEHNLPFPAITYDGIGEKVCTVFDDGPESMAPIVVYLPMTTNPNFSPEFDPQALLNSYLHTANLIYTTQQAKNISGLFEQTALDVTSTILLLAEELIQRKANCSKCLP